MQVRDYALGLDNEDEPSSAVGREYALQRKVEAGGGRRQGAIRNMHAYVGGGIPGCVWGSLDGFLLMDHREH